MAVFLGGVGILKSTDGDASYTISNAGLTNKHSRDVAVNPQDPNMLFLARDGGLLKSLMAAALGF
jgi:hypothetical protein